MSATHKALADAAGRARTELRATGLEIRLTGRASERTSKEIVRLGWTTVPANVKK